MTIGIYKLIFKDTEKTYIGQSINIEKRWTTHLSCLRSGKSPEKLQNAHLAYTLINYEIVLECTLQELNQAEIEAISIYNSFTNGFNSTPSATGPCLSGEDNPSALDTNETYRSILKLLVQKNPSLNKKQIAEICGVSIYTVRHMAALETHSWLKEDMPTEYAILEILANTPYYTGNQYPMLVSPEGQVLEVTHVTNFAKQHGLLQPKVTELLRGTRNMHKGWRRVDA